MIFSDNEHTIVAQCTARGAGALALLRVCGDDAFAIMQRCTYLSDKKTISDYQSHSVIYGSIIDEHRAVVDKVMLIVMRGPKTFTGQDTIEITCHNNQFIIERIIQVVIAAGARLAQQGEFSRRAFLNGKIDLLQAEAINELIQANNQYALQQSLAQLQGSFSHYVAGIEQQLTQCLALSDASFEFLDEENITFGDQIEKHVQSVVATINMLTQSFDQQKQIRQGVRIALIGSVNAGKSSLFNALVGTQRAIVSAQAGTTRDSIESGIYNNNQYWTFVDTAGIRESADVIEQEGIERSYEQAQLADIIILVYDQSRVMNKHEQSVYQQLLEQYAEKIIFVASKSDMPCVQHYMHTLQSLAVSIKYAESVERVRAELARKVDALYARDAAPFLLNQRHYTILLMVKKELATVCTMLHKEVIAYELVSYHLKETTALLNQLTGKNIADNAMDIIFKEFCIGK